MLLKQLKISWELVLNLNVTKKKITVLGLLVVFTSLSILYLKNLNDIGLLPTETIEYAAQDSVTHLLEKKGSESGECQEQVTKSNSDNVGIREKILIEAPSLPLAKVDNDLLEIVNKNSMYLVSNERLYVADEIFPSEWYVHKIQGRIQGDLINGKITYSEDSFFKQKIKQENILISKKLIEGGYVTTKSLETLRKESSLYYSRCSNLINDKELRAITEYFWAAEGRSVIHHWAHFYEGAIIQPELKAQYGILIPAITRLINWLLPKDGNGPSRYIYVAWIIFYLLALAYCAILFKIFNENPITVTITLLIKIIIFINVREFIIYLAPGVHWFRELNFVFIYLISSYYVFNNNKNIYSTNFVLLILFTLIFDPLSGFFGWAAVLSCGGLQLFKTNRYNIKEIVGCVSIVVLVSAVFLFANQSNGYYFASMLNNNLLEGNLSSKGTKYLVINISILFLLIVLYLNKKIDYKFIYFGFVGNISILYYIMTPDWVHYYKSLEYSILMYMCVFIAGLDLITRKIKEEGINFKSKYLVKLNDESFAFCKAALIFILLLIIVSNLQKISKINNKSPLTRLYDGGDGRILFNTEEFIINNRKLKANMSQELVSHLSAYPFQINQSFTISGFDKYILFLYDKKNNFGSVDLRSQLVSRKETGKIISIIQNKGGIYIVDKKNFNIKAKYGPKLSGDKVLIEGRGDYYLGPYNFVNSQLRLAEISEYIHSNCSINKKNSNEGWNTYYCLAKHEGDIIDAQ
jgi:hypothetical protein